MSVEVYVELFLVSCCSHFEIRVQSRKRGLDEERRVLIG